MSIRFDDRRWRRRDTLTWVVVIGLIVGIALLDQHAPDVAAAMGHALDVAGLVVAMTWIVGAALIAAGRRLPIWLVPRPLVPSLLFGLWLLLNTGLRVVAWIAPDVVDHQAVREAIEPANTVVLIALLALFAWTHRRGSSVTGEMGELGERR